MASKEELREAVREFYRFTKAYLGGAIDDMFSHERDILLQAIDDIEITDEALDEACRLAIKNNHSEIYLTINEGTREQYNLPLTYDYILNQKILKNYLLNEARKELGNEKN